MTGVDNGNPTLMLGRMRGDDLTSSLLPNFLAPLKASEGRALS